MTFNLLDLSYFLKSPSFEELHNRETNYLVSHLSLPKKHFDIDNNCNRSFFRSTFSTLRVRHARSRTYDFHIHGFFKKRIALESPPHFPKYRCAENDLRRNTRVPIEITCTSKMNRACKQGAVSTERRARRVVVNSTKNSDEARVKTPFWRRRMKVSSRFDPYSLSAVQPVDEKAPFLKKL